MENFYNINNQNNRAESRNGNLPYLEKIVYTK